MLVEIRNQASKDSVSRDKAKKIVKEELRVASSLTEKLKSLIITHFMASKNA